MNISKNLHGFIGALGLVRENMAVDTGSKMSLWDNVELYVYCSSEQVVEIEKMKKKVKKEGWHWLRTIVTNVAEQEMIEALKNKQIDGCVTCGDVHEFFNLARARIAPLKMVKYPVLAGVLPVDNGVKMIVDVSGYTFETLRDTAGVIGVLSGVYAKVLFELKEIKVCLLKNGYDGKKGVSAVKDTADILEKILHKNNSLKFDGVVEADKILSSDNKAHVVVTDGMTGMILMKYTRGLAGLFMRVLKSVKGSSLVNKIAGRFGDVIFDAFRAKMNVEYGTFVLGLQGVLVKADVHAGANGVYHVMMNALKMCKAKAAMYDELESSLEEFDLAAQSVWSLYANTTKTVQTKKKAVKAV